MRWSVVGLWIGAIAMAGLSGACRQRQGGSTTASDGTVGMPADPDAPTPLLSDQVDPELAQQIYARVKYQMVAEDAEGDVTLGDFETFDFRVVRAYDPTVGAGSGGTPTQDRATIAIVGSFVTEELEAGVEEPIRKCFTLSGSIDVARSGEALSLPPEARADYESGPTGCG